MNATSITNTINISSISSFRSVNERVATAVVPTTAFRNGQRIDRQVIRINPEQLAKVQVINLAAMPYTVTFSSSLIGRWAANRSSRIFSPSFNRAWMWHRIASSAISRASSIVRP